MAVLPAKYYYRKLSCACRFRTCSLVHLKKMIFGDTRCVDRPKLDYASSALLKEYLLRHKYPNIA
jgi:hypothetical protein